MVRRRVSAVRVASLCSVLVFVAAGCGGLGGGEAACVARASEIDAEPLRVDAGGSFRLRGTGFADYRELGGFFGEECPPPLPERGIPVEFQQGGNGAPGPHHAAFGEPAPGGWSAASSSAWRRTSAASSGAGSSSGSSTPRQGTEP